MKRIGTLILIIALFAMIISPLAGCQTEGTKQTADYIFKGAAAIDKVTLKNSPIKKDTAALKRLAKAHSENEIGKPDKPLADDWNPEIADKRSKEIETDFAIWGLWLGGLSLGLFIVSRGLKSIGIYAPEAWLKDAAATIFKRPVKKDPEEKPILKVDLENPTKDEKKDA